MPDPKMPDYQMTIEPPGAPVPARRRNRKWLAFKAGLYMLLGIAAAIGILIAAFVVGSFVASILLVVVAVAVCYFLLRWLWVGVKRAGTRP